jgi:hypothetical protein
MKRGTTVQVKAASPEKAWQRYANKCRRGEVAAYFDLIVVEVSPANVAGNRTFDVTPIEVGR